MFTKVWWRIFFSAGGLAVLIWSCDSTDPSFRGTALDSAIPAGEFTLTDQDSQSFVLSDHRSKIVLLFFGYAYCPDVCPYTLSTWKQVQDALSEDSDKVEFVFVTVDPDRDTVAQLRKHLSVYSSNFYGLTGTPDELQPVYDSFGVYRERVSVSESATGYLMNHTARIFVIEGNGEWRLSYPFDAPAEDIVHDIRQLLKTASTGPSLEVRDVWSRATASDSKGTAGGTGVVYLTIVNHGTEPDHLISARSEVAEVVEIHETIMRGDRMMMQPVPEGVSIPVGEPVALKPAGAHLMLIGLKRPLVAEDQLEVVLEFEKSGTKTVVSNVRGI
jgi:protein SCO1/2